MELTADDEPSPASSSGRAFITTVDGGAMSCEIPIASTTVASTEATVTSCTNAPSNAIAIAHTRSPAVMALRSPSLATIALDRIEISPNTPAKGTSSSPTVTIVSPCTSCSHDGNRNSIPVNSQ